MSDEITGVLEVDRLIEATVKRLLERNLKIPANIRLKPKVIRSIQATLCLFAIDIDDLIKEFLSSTETQCQGAFEDGARCANDYFMGKFCKVCRRERG